MATVETLTQRLEALREIRAAGERSVTYDGVETVYRSDAELAAAIADLERQIAGSSSQPVRRIRVNTSKGL